MKLRIRGFTMVEMMTVVAILAVLGAVAFAAYDHYTNKARAADIVSSYEAVRTQVAGALADPTWATCDELTKRVGRKNLSQNYATLDLGYEAVGDPAKKQFRPVLTVKADAGSGTGSVKAAAAALETLRKSGSLEAKETNESSIVAFAVALSDKNQPQCTKATVVAAAPPAPVLAPGATPALLPKAVPGARPAAAPPLAPGQAPSAQGSAAAPAAGTVAAPPPIAKPASDICPAGYYTDPKNPQSCMAYCPKGYMRDSHGICVTATIQGSECYTCGAYDGAVDGVRRACSRIEIVTRHHETCPTERPYCMNSIFQAAGQSPVLYKQCADQYQVHEQWFMQSSDKVACFQYDSSTFRDDLVCHLGCSGDNCNANALPPQNTLYAP